MAKTSSTDGGFILVYVVAMVAAITLLLLQLQQRHSIPGQSEREVGVLLERTEGQVLLEFIIAGTVAQEFPVDPRYELFRRLLANDPSRANESDEALQQLKAMLASMGFQIDIKQKETTTGTQAKNTESQGVLFPASLASSTITLGQRRYDVRITPGNALPNLNAIPYDSLYRYLGFLGLPEKDAMEMAAVIVDWRDADDFIHDSRGAEREYYLEQRLGYTPRNGYMQNWQELAYLKGMTTERLNLLRNNFMLTPPLYRKVLATSIPKEAIVALTDWRIDDVTTILTLFETQGDLNQQVSGASQLNVSTEQMERFDRLITWAADRDNIRIEISGHHTTQHLDYDIKRKRIIGRW